jgi:predicted ArsR family transcriptional regulator
MVREHDGPVDAADLAGRLGLHVTTVRFHLDALCDQGAITRTRITRTGVGRPRTGYVAVQDRLHYQRLADILAPELANTAETRRRHAERAGRRLADRIAASASREPVATQNIPDVTEPRGTLDRWAATTTEVFQRMGFGPEPIPAAKSTTGKRQRIIRLHACPARDLARAHPEAGCALHLGLLQGLLTNATAAEDDSKPAPHAELEPFVKPELCIAKVISRD